MKYNKKLGLCCLSRLNDKIKFSTMTRKKFLSFHNRKDAIKELSNRTLKNIKSVREAVLHCHKNGWNYRIGSGIVPLWSLKELNINPYEFENFDEILSEFKLCSEEIKRLNVRCSMHPDQYVVPASSTKSVVEKSLIDLELHGKIMDMLGLAQDYSSPINIHMNCFKGSPIQSIRDRFLSIYNSLNPSVRNRLVLENEDKKNSWSVVKLVDLIHSKSKIPITYDNLHHINNPDGCSEKDAYDLCKKTWGSFKPLFHFSGTDISLRNSRAHAEFATEFPVEYLNEDFVDLDFEFKGKDEAMKKFELKY